MLFVYYSSRPLNIFVQVQLITNQNLHNHLYSPYTNILFFFFFHQIPVTVRLIISVTGPQTKSFFVRCAAGTSLPDFSRLFRSFRPAAVPSWVSGTFAKSFSITSNMEHFTQWPPSFKCQVTSMVKKMSSCTPWREGTFAFWQLPFDTECLQRPVLSLIPRQGLRSSHQADSCDQTFMYSLLALSISVRSTPCFTGVIPALIPHKLGFLPLF